MCFVLMAVFTFGLRLFALNQSPLSTLLWGLKIGPVLLCWQTSMTSIVPSLTPPTNVPTDLAQADWYLVKMIFERFH